MSDEADKTEMPESDAGSAAPDPLARALGWKGKGAAEKKELPPKVEAPAVEPQEKLIPLAKEIEGMPLPKGLPPEKEPTEPRRRSRFGLAPVTDMPLPGE